jgi:hypothetical protein
MDKLDIGRHHSHRPGQIDLGLNRVLVPESRAPAARLQTQLRPAAVSAIPREPFHLPAAVYRGCHNRVLNESRQSCLQQLGGMIDSEAIISISPGTRQNLSALCCWAPIWQAIFQGGLSMTAYEKQCSTWARRLTWPENSGGPGLYDSRTSEPPPPRRLAAATGLALGLWRRPSS